VAFAISLANQKGGVGKTTVTVNLAAALARHGFRVLVVDTDPQANATSSLGVLDEFAPSLLDVLMGEVRAEEAIVERRGKDGSLLYVLPAPPSLALSNAPLNDGLKTISNVLLDVKDQYDFIMIDTPPSVGELMLSAIAASDGVIVPIPPEYLALEGLSQLMAVVRTVRSGLNPLLEVVGVVINMWNPRTLLARQVRDEVKRRLGGLAFDTYIPRTVRLAEAPSFGMTIFEYEPSSPAVEAFDRLARELEDRINSLGV